MQCSAAELVWNLATFIMKLTPRSRFYTTKWLGPLHNITKIANVIFNT